MFEHAKKPGLNAYLNMFKQPFRIDNSQLHPQAA